MDYTNRDRVSLISVSLLLIIHRQSSINITVQQFFARRHQRRRFQLRHLQGLSAFYVHLRARHELASQQPERQTRENKERNTHSDARNPAM